MGNPIRQNQGVEGGNMCQCGNHNNDRAELEIRRKIDAVQKELSQCKRLQPGCERRGAPGFQDKIDRLQGELSGLQSALAALRG